MWFSAHGLFGSQGFKIIKVFENFEGFWVTVEKVFQGFSKPTVSRTLHKEFHRKEANKVGHFRISGGFR